MTKTKTGQVKRAMRDHPLAVVIVMSALGFPLALLVNWLMNSVAMLAVLFVLGCVAAVLLEQYRPHAQKPMEVSMMAARALGVLLAGFVSFPFSNQNLKKKFIIFVL